MINRSQRRRPGAISFVRGKFGLTQQQLADALGISRSLVAMLETGKRKLPALARHAYAEMSRSAAELPPSSTITIRRGRKPRGTHSKLFTIPVVTNYRPVITARKLRIDNYPLEKLTNARQYEALRKELKDRKELLSYHYKGLEFKRKGMELKGVHLSGKLMLVNALLDNGKRSVDILPDGNTKDRIVLQNALNNYKQIKLVQQLKKYDPIALLKVELQLNYLKGHIALMDEYILKY